MSDTERCPECGGIGYLLNEYHAGAGPSDPALPLSLNLTACYYPACDAPKEPRPIATLGVLGMFTDVVRHPSNGTVMALAGFTKAEFR